MTDDIIEEIIFIQYPEREPRLLPWFHIRDTRSAIDAVLAELRVDNWAESAYVDWMTAAEVLNRRQGG